MKISLLSIFASVLASQVAGTALDNCKPTNHPAFFNCGSEFDSIIVSGINISPLKPSKGDEAVLTITGELKVTLTNQARIKFKATSNGVVVKEVETEFCAFLSERNPGVICPVSPKTLDFSLGLKIPTDLPFGPYIIHASANQGDLRLFEFNVVTILA